MRLQKSCFRIKKSIIECNLAQIGVRRKAKNHCFWLKQGILEPYMTPQSSKYLSKMCEYDFSGPKPSKYIILSNKNIFDKTFPLNKTGENEESAPPAFNSLLRAFISLYRP